MNGMNIGKSWDDAACTSCPIMIPHGKKADTETTRSLPRSKRSLGLQRPQQLRMVHGSKLSLGEEEYMHMCKSSLGMIPDILKLQQHRHDKNMCLHYLYIRYNIYNIMFKIRVVRLHIYIYTHIVVWTHSPPPYKSCGSMV